MATFRDLKKAASAILRSQSKPGNTVTADDRVGELLRRIEEFAQQDRAADRERAIRVSSDGMYVRRNTGSYTSKSEGEQARLIIERLKHKSK